MIQSNANKNEQIRNAPDFQHGTFFRECTILTISSKQTKRSNIMSNRISRNQLDMLLESLNKQDESTEYSFGAAYGGMKLQSHGGSRDVLTTGYTTKANLWDNMQSYIRGIGIARNQ